MKSGFLWSALRVLRQRFEAPIGELQETNPLERGLNRAGSLRARIGDLDLLNLPAMFLTLLEGILEVIFV